MPAIFSRTSKLGCESISIPATKCKTGSKLAKIKGSVCEKCYALSGAYLWPVVQQAMEFRLEHLEAIDVVPKTVAELNKKKNPFFRWFDSGDVQDVRMALNIIDICEATPHKKHWIPTKERKIWQDALKIKALPDNAVIRYSAHMVDQAPPEKWENSSAVITDIFQAIGKLCEAYRTKKNGDMITDKEFQTAKKERKIGKLDLGHCGNCRDCWSREVKTVSYPQH